MSWHGPFIVQESALLRAAVICWQPNDGACKQGWPVPEPLQKTIRLGHRGSSLD